MRIRWTTDAADDLERIAVYLLRENPSAARRAIQTITDGITILTRFPNRGRPGRSPDTRELLFPSLPYIVVYFVKEQAIEILRIYHAAQDWP
jgi:addiction module RelE/StbE family toxin